MHNLYFRGKNKIKNKKVMKKMEKIIITRHKGAVDWIKKHYPKFSVFKHLTHASEEDIEGNIIVGTLPVNLAVLSKEYWHLSMDIPAEFRGKELTIEDMESFNCLLQRYEINLAIKNESSKYKECPYCKKSKIHAIRHDNDNDAEYILCIPHRILDFYTKNQYNPGNVTCRNPASAEAYSLAYFKNGNKVIISNILEYRKRNKYIVDRPEFIFSVIAEAIPLLIYYEYKYVYSIFYPCIIADVKDGEYTNRRFAVIFGIRDMILDDKYYWGVLEANIQNLFNYIGYNPIISLIDTCTYGDAKPNKCDDEVDLYSQRESCPDCEEK